MIHSPPAGRRVSETAPTVNRANHKSVAVPLHSGVLVAHVDSDLANEFVGCGAARSFRNGRRRYVRLERGISVQRSVTGWALIEEERRVYGDTKVRRGMMAFDRSPLRWEGPQPAGTPEVKT